MVRVFQTRYGPKEGNCFQACLATVLGLPLEDVPHFALLGDEQWGRAFQKWLNARGLYASVMLVPDELTVAELVPRGVCLVGGEGGRGCKHEVVYRDGKLWHDPLLCGTGLVKVEDIIIIAALDWTAYSPVRTESAAGECPLSHPVAKQVGVDGAGTAVVDADASSG